MGIPSLRVRLPDFNHGVVDRHAVTVEHGALDADLRAGGVRGHQIGASGFLPVVDVAWFPIATAVRRKAVCEEWADGL
jgi:hypothetical protein